MAPPHNQIPQFSPIADVSTLEALAAALHQQGLVKRPGTSGWDVVRFLGQLLIGALLAYGVVTSRVAVLESRVDIMRADLSEIRGDVKLLLQRVR